MDRSEKFNLLRAASEATHGALGLWIFDEWASHNERYYGSELNTIALIWGLTPHGKALGHFESWIPRITLHPSLISASRYGDGNPWDEGQNLGKRLASDVLLHEMIHQKLYQTHGTNGSEEGTSSHNNPYWVGEVNRLAPLLGLDVKAQVVKQKRVRTGTHYDENGKKRVEYKRPWGDPDGEYLTLKMLSRFPDKCRPLGYFTQDEMELLAGHDAD